MAVVDTVVNRSGASRGFLGRYSGSVMRRVSERLVETRVVGVPAAVLTWRKIDAPAGHYLRFDGGQRVTLTTAEATTWANADRATFVSLLTAKWATRVPG